MNDNSLWNGLLRNLKDLKEVTLLCKLDGSLENDQTLVDNESETKNGVIQIRCGEDIFREYRKEFENLSLESIGIKLKFED